MINTNQHCANHEAARSRKFSIFRRRVKLQSSPPAGVIFKQADTPEELTQVCKLLYDSYTQVGYMKEDDTGYRFTPYYILPSSYTLIAKQGDTVIATTTVIVKSQEELPVEQIFSLDHIAKWDRRIAEASSLTVHPDYRSQEGSLIHALLKYMFQVAREDLGIHDLVMACTPKHMDFYEALLLFRRLSHEVIDAFDYVNGTTATGAFLNFTEMHADYQRVYGDTPEERNLFKYYMEYEFDSFQKLSKVSTAYDGNRWSAKELEHFLQGPIQGAASLTPDELKLLRRHYPTHEYDHLFGAQEVTSALMDTDIAGLVRLRTNMETPVVLRRIETDRVHLTTPKPYELLNAKELRLLLGTYARSPIKVQSITLMGGPNAIVRFDPTSSPQVRELLSNATSPKPEATLTDIFAEAFHPPELAHAG